MRLQTNSFTMTGAFSIGNTAAQACWIFLESVNFGSCIPMPAEWGYPENTINCGDPNKNRRIGTNKSIEGSAPSLSKPTRRWGSTGDMIRKLLVALLLVSLWSIAAQAQGLPPPIHRSWEVSIFAGGSLISDESSLTPVAGSSSQTSRTVGLSYATGSQFGMRLTENRWKNWGAAMEYSFSNQPLTFTNLSDAVPSLSLGHSIHRFSYDVLYYPLDRSHRLRPFAFAGTGVSLFYVKSASKDAAAAYNVHLNDPWKFSMRWGGGVKYLIKDQFAVAFQYTSNTSGIPQYGLPGTGYVASGQYVPGFRPDGLLNNRLISLSFNYQWGSR